MSALKTRFHVTAHMLMVASGSRCSVILGRDRSADPTGPEHNAEGVVHHSQQETIYVCAS